MDKINPIDYFSNKPGDEKASFSISHFANNWLFKRERPKGEKR
jgi:hypothetical protein